MRKCIRRYVENGYTKVKYITEEDVNKEIEENSLPKEMSSDEEEELRRRLIFDISDGSEQAVIIMAKLSLIAIGGLIHLGFEASSICEHFKKIFGSDIEKFEDVLSSTEHLTRRERSWINRKNIYDRLCNLIVGQH